MLLLIKAAKLSRQRLEPDPRSPNTPHTLIKVVDLSTQALAAGPSV